MSGDNSRFFQLCDGDSEFEQGFLFDTGVLNSATQKSKSASAEKTVSKSVKPSGVLQTTMAWGVKEWEEYQQYLPNVMEITAESNINNYNPIKEYRLNKLFRSVNLVSSQARYFTDTISINFSNAIKASLCQEAVIFAPGHFILPTSTFSNSNNKPNYNYYHNQNFTELLSTMTSSTGERARLLCLAATNPYNRDDKGVYSKQQHLGTNIKYIEGSVAKVDNTNRIAKSLKSWLFHHPEITKVGIMAPELINKVFCCEEELPASLKKGAYRIYNCSITFIKEDYETETRQYEVMCLPSFLNMTEYEDRIMSVTADMISLLLHHTKPPRVKTKVLRSVEIAKKIVKKAIAKNVPLAIDIETTGLNPVYYGQKIISAAVSNGNYTWVFPVQHPKYPKYDFLDILSVFFRAKGLVLILQNAPYDIKWWSYFTGEYPKATIRDTQLLDHWLFESRGSVCKKINLGGSYNMDGQIPRYLGYSSHKPMLEEAIKSASLRNPTPTLTTTQRANITVPEVEQIIKTVNDPYYVEPNSGAYSEVPLFLLLKYNAEDAYATWHIYDKQRQLIDQQTGGKWPRVILDLMERMVHTQVEIALTGTPLDYNLIIEKITVANTTILNCGERVREATSDGFNLNAPAQIMDYLIKNYDVKKDIFWDMTKRKYSANITTLSRLKNDIPWMEDLLSYKKAMKLKGTYIIPMLTYSTRGRLYFGILPTGTVTGRWASMNPNSQNFPKSLVLEGKKIGVKEVIAAPKGQIFADLDLASAEVKVLTAVCPDKRLIKVLKDGLDPHSYTAHLVSQTTDKPKTYEEISRSHMKMDHLIDEPITAEDVANEMLRKNAKHVTFGCIYRIGKMGLGSQVAFKYEYDKTKSFLQNEEAKQAKGEGIAENLLGVFFKDVYPTLGEVFLRSDSQVFNNYYGESLFGRRRRYTHTIIPMVNYLVKKSGLYKEDESGILKLKNCLELITDKRSFRQNLNFEVQSPTSDYMQYYIDYIITEGKKKLPGFGFCITVHDSALLHFDDTQESQELFKNICDRGMDYLNTLSDKLPVTIGYGLGFDYHYCPVNVKEKKIA